MTSNTLTDREALYCLCHVPGFGGVTIRGLKDTFGTYLSAWRVKPQELRKSGALTERRAEVFLESRKYESVWRKEFAGLAQKNIRVIAECDPDYPTRFLPYKDRPAVLFVKGSLPENEVPSVAIVGARACTEYGKEAAGFYAGELANAGVNILRSLGLRGKRLLPTGKLQNFPCHGGKRRHPLGVRPGNPPRRHEFPHAQPDHQCPR